MILYFLAEYKNIQKGIIHNWIYQIYQYLCQFLHPLNVDILQVELEILCK